jgi:hypothetical protein
VERVHSQDEEARVRCRAVERGVEGTEEDDDVLRDLRCVLKTEFGHCLANLSLFVGNLDKTMTERTSSSMSTSVCSAPRRALVILASQLRE